MPRRSPHAGGFLLAAAIFIGLVVGIIYGQLVYGMLGGAAIGVVGALAVWLLDRRRA